MRSNTGMANRRGVETCASRKSPPAVKTLAWLGWQEVRLLTEMCVWDYGSYLRIL